MSTYDSLENDLISAILGWEIIKNANIAIYKAFGVAKQVDFSIRYVPKTMGISTRTAGIPIGGLNLD